MLRARVAELLTHPERGIPAQLTPLVHAFDEVGRPASVMEWLKRCPGGVRLRELAVRAHDEVITHELLDAYPQTSELHRIRDLLVHTAVLPARAELLDRNAVWLDTVLNHVPPHHAHIVRPFATWYALRRARQRSRKHPTTAGAATWVRTQTLLALHFLSWLDERGKTLDNTSQADLDSWLTEGRACRYLIRGFITWSGARGLCKDLTVPSRSSGDPCDFLAESDRWNLLTRCLQDGALPLEVRAAGALVLLYGRTLTAIAALTVGDICQMKDETYVRFGESSVLLPPSLALLMRTLSCKSPPGGALHDRHRENRPLFPGRSPGRSSTGNVLARKLRQHGIEPRRARQSAVSAWTGDVPTPIAAELLGIHISTATKWAARTRRDWTGYLAARCSESPDGGNTAPSE